MYGALVSLPEHGGKDVFLHVNDLLVPESRVHCGVAVEFEVRTSGRGLKASAVRLMDAAAGAYGASPASTASAHTPGAASPASPSAAFTTAEWEDRTCDVLSPREYTTAMTELLLRTEPSLTGEQILHIRCEVLKFAVGHGWAED